METVETVEVARMRRYDDPVEVRRGMVAGEQGPVEGPEQFLWHGRLWKVYDVVGHWRETGAWWQSRDVAPVLGADDPTTTDCSSDPAVGTSVHDLLAEREVWRVEAGRGATAGRGVFDLAFDWAQGGWLLTRCWD